MLPSLPQSLRQTLAGETIEGETLTLLADGTNTSHLGLWVAAPALEEVGYVEPAPGSRIVLLQAGQPAHLTRRDAGLAHVLKPLIDITAKKCILYLTCGAVGGFQLGLNFLSHGVLSCCNID